MSYLVQFGNNILSNNRFGVLGGNHYSSVVSEVQSQPIARGRGAVVLNNRDKERELIISGLIKKDNTSLSKAIEDLDYIFSAQDQLLRIIPTYSQVVADYLTANYTLSGDAVSATTTYTDYQIGNAGLAFNIDVSTTASNFAAIQYINPSPVDLSSVSEKGNFEFGIKIPDAQYVESIEVRVGNDSSNYYSATVFADYQGNAFNYGWNWLSVPWGNSGLPTGQVYDSKMTETGTVDDATLDYVYVQINYNASAADINNCIFGGCIWVDEAQVRNFPSFVSSAVQKQQNGGNDNNFIRWTVSLLNYTGYSRATHEILASTYTNINGTSVDTNFYLGNTQILPKFSLAIVSVTALTQLNLTNLRNNESVRFLPSGVTAGDSFILGGLNKIFTKNGTEIDRTGIIPQYMPALNKTQIQFLGGNPTTQSLASLDGFVTQLGYLDEIVAYKITATRTGNVASAFFIFRGNESSQGRIELWSDSANLPNTILDSSAPFAVIQNASQITYSALFTASAAVVSGTAYWLALRWVSGPTGTINDGWSVLADNNTTTATYAKLRFGVTTWSTAENRRIGYSLTIAETLVGSINYEQSYYPLYR